VVLGRCAFDVFSFSGFSQEAALAKDHRWPGAQGK
jgi:hypothetical protein